MTSTKPKAIEVSVKEGAVLWDSVKVRTVNAGQALKDVAISVKYPKPQN